MGTMPDGTMTKDEVMRFLKSKGTAQTRKIYKRHGGREPMFGVKVADMKTVVKKVKKDHDLALALYATGNVDAMYLAGLIADETKMTKAHLNRWVREASFGMLCNYTVPWVASESARGWELGLKWIDSKKESTASAGWSTLASLVSIKSDDQLDVKRLAALLDRVVRDVHTAPNGVRYAMNGFVISVGGYVTSLTKKAIAAGRKIGVVEVDVGETSCKVPFIVEYVQKMVKRGNVGKKRKTARC